MSKILVSGLSNMETTCRIESFPVEYTPVDYNFFGVNSLPSGVGVNISLALNALGDEVKILSIVGEDYEGDSVIDLLKRNKVNTEYILRDGQTASSVVLYDDNGKRKIYCDLKDIQEKEYDKIMFKKAAYDCDALILSNVNFSRKLLKAAKDLSKIIITDVHCISDIKDEYNKEFIENSNVVFLSNENIVSREKDFILELAEKYNCELFICGMGDKGSLMYKARTKSFIEVDACHDYEVVNTIGAGDALLSAFVHFYIKGESPENALKLANHFAAKKISSVGASSGFATEDEIYNDM